MSAAQGQRVPQPPGNIGVWGGHRADGPREGRQPDSHSAARRPTAAWAQEAGTGTKRKEQPECGQGPALLAGNYYPCPALCAVSRKPGPECVACEGLPHRLAVDGSGARRRRSSSGRRQRSSAATEPRRIPGAWGTRGNKRMPENSRGQSKQTGRYREKEREKERGRERERESQRGGDKKTQPEQTEKGAEGAPERKAPASAGSQPRRWPQVAPEARGGQGGAVGLQRASARARRGPPGPAGGQGGSRSTTPKHSHHHPNAPQGQPAPHPTQPPEDTPSAKGRKSGRELKAPKW